MNQVVDSGTDNDAAGEHDQNQKVALLGRQQLRVFQVDQRLGKQSVKSGEDENAA